MNIKDLYIEFFKSKGHAFIKSAPIIPENDPSCLFNTAGMQPLIPYLMGEKHPEGTRLVDVQKCLRCTDLDAIGDNTHHTFFEMLGNWSLGDYFKKESIAWSFEFLTTVLKIPVSKLAVTVFEGNADIPADTESIELWKQMGIKEERIARLGVEDNFWIAGDSGPCGPDTEIFYWTGLEEAPELYDPKDERWVEIWNNVFMQYHKASDGTITELAQKNVDTGMGVERITAVLEGTSDNYQTSLLKDIIEYIEKVSSKKYEENQTSMRIIADHLRAIVMISGDDAILWPSNTDRGYILRRLIRRMIRHAKKIGIDLDSDFDLEIARNYIAKYKKYYPELERNEKHIMEVLATEKKKFGRTLDKGLREFDKLIQKEGCTKIDGVEAFHLYDTYGFPIELTVELASEKNIAVDVAGFEEKFKEHQEKSRAGSTGKFKGGLASDSDMNIKYHTATHLLNAAIKKLINPDSYQKGSNITDERMRFDFPCDHKLTDEEKSMLENQVNEWIQASIPVEHFDVKKEEAVKMGAEAQFIERYGDVVTVYKIDDVSLEICGGPHVENTKELGHFKIKKEESSSAGVRRIKAILEEQ